MGLLGEMFGEKEAHQDWKAENSESKVVSLAEYKAQKGSGRIIDDAGSDFTQMEAQQAAQKDLLESLE